MEIPGYDRTMGVEPHRSSSETVEIADKMLDKFIAQDSVFPSEIDKMRLQMAEGAERPLNRVTLSGMQDNDYPCKMSFPHLSDYNQLRLHSKTFLPPEISEQCANVGRETMMGFFPEISRAWLVVESDIYIWNYETGGDVAYYDGLSELIVSVGLVRPKPNIFHGQVKHLLVITTCLEVVVLGVLLNPSLDRKVGAELQLTPEIVYRVATDLVPMFSVSGTQEGRIFLGGKDGCLYEIEYQKELNWWGQRCNKVNHSKGLLSFLVPGMLASVLWEADGIIQIAVDNSRKILYTLSEKGNLQAFSLGSDGMSICRVGCLSSHTITAQARQVHSSLENAHMSRVTSICPVQLEDSPHLGLIGVSTAGTRFYFTTHNVNDQPTSLNLLHVRMPPGFAPHTPNMTTSQVIGAKLISGNFVALTSSRESGQEQLWVFSGDVYATKNWFSEGISLSSVQGGPVAAVAHVQTSDNPGEDRTRAPMLVYQQYHSLDRVVVLTHQGIETYELLRPVDVLGDLLKACNGPDNELVKNFFSLVGYEQGCAMALILAINPNAGNLQMAEWATRAFFLYGAEPRPTPSVPPASPGAAHYTLPAGFRPGKVSTPIVNKPSAAPCPEPSQYYPAQQASVLGQTPYQQAQAHQQTVSVTLNTAKHNGLYLFLARVYRPVWLKKVVVKTRTGADCREVLTSRLNSRLISFVTSQLFMLKAFLEKHSPLTSNNLALYELAGSGSPGQQGQPSLASTRRAFYQDMVAFEKQSLDSMKLLMDQSLQVLGLWRVSLDHHFHVITDSMTYEQKVQLGEATLRHIVLAGHDLCTTIINKLINMYLQDKGSVGAISSRLREVCPSLYKNEDATITKANEILLQAKDEKDPEEKSKKLREAIKRCKEVSPHLDLALLCKQLTLCKYYEGVLELCQDVADKLDPNKLAQTFFAKHKPAEDAAGSKAYITRLNVYKEVGHMLDSLFSECQVSVNCPMSAPQTQKELGNAVMLALLVEDEVCHVVVYDWVLARGMGPSLVTMGRPSLENYLARPSSRFFPIDGGAPHPILEQTRDLLWQYQQKHGQHTAAAKTLHNLATNPSDSINLQQRLSYLGKAVMCMRSDEAGCAPHLGIFLQELEDMVQVARIQKQIYDKLACLPPEQRPDDALRKLNSNLLSITELYEEYAEPFQLWECKLTILDCAGHDDKQLIQDIWEKIIEEELRRTGNGSPDDQMSLLMNKVKSLGQRFTVTSPCFPVAFLVWQLEVLSCRLKVNKSHVHAGMTTTGVSITTLLEIYEKLFSMDDRCWVNEGNELHLIQVIASLADSFVSNPWAVPTATRRALAVQMHDLITKCLSVLYSKPDTAQLVNYLKTIQSSLSRM